MNDFAPQLSLVIVGLAVGAVPVAIFFVASELRAVRKVLQARWDYDRYKRWLEFRADSQASYVLYVPELLQKPHILPDMLREPLEPHQRGKGKVSQP